MSARALIIDRDELFGERIGQVLSRYGYSVETKVSGREGIEHARSIRPNLILLSVELDDTSGYSICAKMKKDPELKDVPLVIMSDKATQETFEHHKKLKTRAQLYLMKPFDPEGLIHSLSTLGIVSLGNKTPVSDLRASPMDSLEVEEIELGWDGKPTVDEDQHTSKASDDIIREEGLVILNREESYNGQSAAIYQNGSNAPSEHLPQDSDGYADPGQTILDAFDDFDGEMALDKTEALVAKPRVRDDTRRIFESSLGVVESNIPQVDNSFSHDIEDLQAEISPKQANGEMIVSKVSFGDDVLGQDEKAMLDEVADEDDIRTSIGEIPKSLYQPQLVVESPDSAVTSTTNARPPSSTSTPPIPSLDDEPLVQQRTGSGSLLAGRSRDVVALKQEINAKGREILGLRDQLQSRDIQILEAQEKETELDERIVQLEEALSDLDQLRINRESEHAALAQKHDQYVSVTEQQTEALKSNLSSAEQRVGELEGIIESLNNEITNLRDSLSQAESASTEHSSRIDTLEGNLATSISENEEKKQKLDRAIETIEGLEAKQSL